EAFTHPSCFLGGRSASSASCAGWADGTGHKDAENEPTDEHSRISAQCECRKRTRNSARVHRCISALVCVSLLLCFLFFAFRRFTSKTPMTARRRMPSLVRSLSARLLALTVLFVMLSEVLIFAPSAGNFRLNYLLERSKAGDIAILALLATPNNMVSNDLEYELLKRADAYVIAMTRPDGAKLMLGSMPPPIDASFDLRKRGFFTLIGDAFDTLFQSRNRVLRIIAPSPRHPQITIEIVIDETPMRTALIDCSYRILALSIVISLATAAFVYLSLQWLLVRPMRRLTESMVAFRENPEDLSHPLPVTTRTDELGVAQHELADMQTKLRAALQQKTRLAALGTAVTKINHDLRNILTTAQLVADRLAGSDNPEVKRMTPTLLAAIDRAIDLCSKTLT